MVIFTQFSNRPEVCIWKPQGGKQHPWETEGDALCPKEALPAGPQQARALWTVSAVPPRWRAAAVRTVSRRSPGPGWRVCGNRIKERAGGFKCSNAFSFFPLSFYSFLDTFLLNVPLSAPRLSYCPQHLLSYCLLLSWWEDNDLVSLPHSSDVSGAALIFQLLHYMIKM